MECMMYRAIFLCLVFVTSLQGYNITTKSCMYHESHIDTGESCYYHCAVSGLKEGDYFGVAKVGILYYFTVGGTNKGTNVQIYSSEDDLNTKLPTRYGAIPGSNEVNITISDARIEDLGNFTCWIRNSEGKVQEESYISPILIFGTQLEEYWELLDLNGTQELRYDKDQEVTLPLQDVKRLSYRAEISEAIAVQPGLMLELEDGDTTEHMLTHFTLHHETPLRGETDEVGLLHNVSSLRQEYGADPDFLRLSLTGKPIFHGTFFYGNRFGYKSSLVLNLIFAAKFECDRTLSADVGDTVDFFCTVYVNPEYSSFALRLPGKEEPVENSNPGEGFNFAVTKTEEWRYNFVLTYKNIGVEAFGLNYLIVWNSEGQADHEFTITNSATPRYMNPKEQIISLLLLLFFSKYI